MRYLGWAVLALIMMLVASPAAAGDWSDEQKEVWKNVETYWDLSAREDLDGFLSYFHDDFLGWVRGQWYPTSKADRREGIERDFETSESEFYSLKPAGIRVHGDVAIVHYFFTMVNRDAEGEEETVFGHWTDILMKQGDKWVMIGDAGGAVSDDD